MKFTFHSTVNDISPNTVTDTGDICLSLPARLASSYIVRAVVRELLGYAGVESQMAFRLVVTVDELFSNAVRHGSGGHGSAVHVHLRLQGDTMYVTVADDGSGKPATPESVRAQLCGKQRRATDTSGRGLSLFAKEWADNVQVEASKHGGIAVSIHKKLALEPKPDAALAES